MGHTQVEHHSGRRKFVDTVSKAIRPRKAPASDKASEPAVERQEAEYDQVDRRLMDTFPASDAVARY